MSATISRRADKWYVSISVEVQNLDLPKAENQGVVGVDLGYFNHKKIQQLLLGIFT